MFGTKVMILRRLHLVQVIKKCNNVKELSQSLDHSDFLHLKEMRLPLKFGDTIINDSFTLQSIENKGFVNAINTKLKTFDTITPEIKKLSDMIELHIGVKI